MTAPTTTAVAAMHMFIRQLLAIQSTKASPQLQYNLPRRHGMVALLQQYSTTNPSNTSTSTSIHPAMRHLYQPNIAETCIDLWHTLLSSVKSARLDWQTITERPSELENGIIWLSHARLTALLAEQNLACANIPPILFHLIMPATNNLYPNAFLCQHRIASQHCYSTNTTNNKQNNDNKARQSPIMRHAYAFSLSRLTCL